MPETATPWQPELIQVLVPMALPSQTSPLSLISGSGSPTPCQAISALLTGNKTNLTIESKFGCCVFFFSLRYVLKWLSRGQTGCHSWQGTEGRRAQLKVGRQQVQPEPLWSTSPSWTPGRGGWDREPARAILICVQL